MRRYFNNGTSLKDVVKGAGKLTPGGNVVGTLKDIRDRKSPLNKKTETKEEKRKRFDKKMSMISSKVKKLGDLPKGKVYRLDEIPTDKKLELRDTRKYGGRMKLKGGSFPDLNKDGKITKADILMGRGVIKKKKGKK